LPWIEDTPEIDLDQARMRHKNTNLKGEQLMRGKKKSTTYYRWIVLALSFFTMLAAYSLRYNFSVFYVAILSYFGWSRGATAAGFSINLIVYALSCPIVGNLIDRFGARRIVPIGAVLLGFTLLCSYVITTIWHFYIIIGVSAFGTCAIGFVAHVPVITNWFSERRGMAVGILSAGVTSSAVIAPAVQYCISLLGWKGTFMIHSVVYVFIVAPLAAILQRQQPEYTDVVVGDGGAEVKTGMNVVHMDDLVVDKEWVLHEWTPTNALKTQRFWYVAMTCIFLGLYCYTILTHQVAYLTDMGYSGAFAAGIVAVFCIFATVASFCAFISDYLGREISFTIGSLCSLIGLVVLMSTTSNIYAWLPFLYAVIFGYGYGLSVSVMATLPSDLFQGKHFGVINGILMGFFVFGGATGPWIAGHIFDITGSYGKVFPLLYFSVFASTVFVWLSLPMKVRAVPGRVSKIS